MTVDEDATDLKRKFQDRWGSFRRMIALHPLTGFWCGVGAGVLAHVAHP
jgi:hypothetical protein